ncbi:hypothetical protein SASPL_153443 [Salvia splendens]|uniref:Uncharacterized protein n=1 Tax=Salvia splendens TaxID=180675 RepID=A0A8X8Z119_SALSN|nr:hypothetical protein SASPL_153443 [Salvia splendens]
MLYAINHSVQSLRLHAPTKLTLRLPEALISCKTRCGSSSSGSPIKVPGRLSLPNLKTLLLQTSSLVFDDDDVSMEPFSGLPELEKLTLDPTYTSLHWIVFKTPKLRVLEITNVFLISDPDKDDCEKYGYSDDGHYDFDI